MQKSQTGAETVKPDPSLTTSREEWFRQIIPVIAITAAVSMLSGCRRSTALSEVAGVDSAFKARKGDLAIEVTESGSIKAISLTNTEEMIAEVGIQDALVDKVRPGQVAIIIAEPFPDKTFHGKVISIEPLPDPQHIHPSPDVKVYKTKVSIEETETSLRPGMSAKVVILVDIMDDVLMVPVAAVENRGDRQICYVATESGTEEREVQIGAFNDRFVEIVAGLEPGENVLLIYP